MIIKKFEAETETQAILKAREELGEKAIVMNIKTTKPKGLFSFLRKTVVEVTAAIDENGQNMSSTATIDLEQLKAALNEEKTPSAIEEKLNSLTQLISTQISSNQETEEKKKESKKPAKEKKEDFWDKSLQLIYEQLVRNEVEPVYAKQMIYEVTKKGDKDIQLDNILSAVYQRIVLNLGEMETIQFQGKKPKIVFFIGPTGVGKTTTLAKIASKHKLENNAKIAMITADTYRIAAVEQLKIYANILSVPVEVIYEVNELKDNIEKFNQYDLILVDTAGRSHKNLEQCQDVKDLISSVSEYEKEVYLVLSATTKYKDMQKIVDTYSDIPGCRLIFTKLDETSAYGNILNMKLKTDLALSYTTYGQDVPDDICIMDSQMIAKQLLGGNE
ncbi:MAG: flagellar biosynthesis protein FlhF [Lachnospiraceae bacterium]|nr:flagellar biosynthesis protein FlhF [Lachnospiraceae bacterium]